ncbi:MAG TPA: nucleotidyltransferase [Gaiellaceae bacterium]|nr:nucleotidyltransferase [Gaiellaceae bacterium]
MPPEADNPFEHLLETLKLAAAALREAGVRFVLGGGLAIWALGGPETEHDVDFFVKPADAERALQALTKAGFRTEEPPEGWLFKGFRDDVMVDLIYDPTGFEVDDEFLDRAEMREVQAVRMPVMRAEDVLVTKLLAMREHEVDYDRVLEIARTVREQIDWDEVRDRTNDSPYAKAFFTLVDELGVSA